HPGSPQGNVFISKALGRGSTARAKLVERPHFSTQLSTRNYLEGNFIRRPSSSTSSILQ
ncbi:hypothetical protein STEG23_015954, partial [Scotinomys teguina]